MFASCYVASQQEQVGVARELDQVIGGSRVARVRERRAAGLDAVAERLQPTWTISSPSDPERPDRELVAVVHAP